MNISFVNALHPCRYPIDREHYSLLPVSADEVGQGAVAAQQGGHKGHKGPNRLGVSSGMHLGIVLPIAHFSPIAVPPASEVRATMGKWS